MVVFTCNNCGDSLQKPKVAKHYQFQCRNPVFLTCVDCFKDFIGDEYIHHTKCVTENERYGGKDYVPTKSSNKGEKKQETWLNIVHNVLNNSTNLTAPERNFLNSISKYENIPRKKPKFMNFIRNVFSNRVNMTIAENVWDKMENAFKGATIDSNKKENNNQNNVVVENRKNLNMCIENDKTQLINSIKESKETENKKSKTPKRFLENDEINNCQERNKKKQNTNEICPFENDIKFSWKSAIFNIVTIKGEISIKKLRKKVVTQYLSNFPDTTLEKATSKFEKKLLKVSNISITNDKVKLLVG